MAECIQKTRLPTGKPEIDVTQLRAIRSPVQLTTRPVRRQLMVDTFALFETFTRNRNEAERLADPFEKRLELEAGQRELAAGLRGIELGSVIAPLSARELAVMPYVWALSDSNLALLFKEGRALNDYETRLSGDGLCEAARLHSRFPSTTLRNLVDLALSDIGHRVVDLFAARDLSRDEANRVSTALASACHPVALCRLPAKLYLSEPVQGIEQKKRGRYNTVRQVRWKDPQTNALHDRLFKPEMLEQEIADTNKADFDRLGYRRPRDFNGRNLAADALDRLLGWNVMCRLEPALVGGRIGIAMEIAQGEMLVVRDSLSVYNPRKVESMHRAYRRDPLGFMKKHRAVDVRFNKHSVCLTRFRFTTATAEKTLCTDMKIARQLVQKSFFDFLVANFDAHDGNYRIDVANSAVRSFDYDFCFSIKVVAETELVCRVGLPLSSDEDMKNDLLQLDPEVLRSACQHYISEDALAEFVQRIEWLQEYVRHIYCFENSDKAWRENLDFFRSSPDTSYLGRDLNALPFEPWRGNENTDD